MRAVAPCARATRRAFTGKNRLPGDLQPIAGHRALAHTLHRLTARMNKETVMSRLMTVLFVTGALTACGADDDTAAARRAFSAHLDAARDEIAKHHDGVMRASDKGTVMLEMSRHETAMDEVMDRMDGEMRQMSGCMGMMNGMDHMGMDMMMNTMMDDFHGMMSTHRADLEAAVDADASRAVCSTHTSSMRQMLDGMQDNLDEMTCD